MTHKLARTSAAPFDDELMLRTEEDGDLEAAETSDCVAIYETAAQGATMKIVVPVSDAAGLTAEFVVEAADACDDDSFEEIARSEPITETGEYLVGFSTQRHYVRLVVEVESQEICLGEVVVGIVPLGI